MSGSRNLQLFKKNPDSVPVVYAVWGYGVLAIPAAKFTLEETLFSPPSNTSLVVRAAVSNAMVLAAFSVMSGMYGYFGHSQDFFLSGEFGFRFALKYICVIEPVRMIWKLWGPYVLGQK